MRAWTYLGVASLSVLVMGLPACGSGGGDSGTAAGGAASNSSASTGSGGGGAAAGSGGAGGGGAAGGAGPLALEGYGTSSSFGDGGEACHVTHLDDAGPGSLRSCVVDRDSSDDNPTPRRVVFDVGGQILLLSDIAVRQPYLTVDGLSAPEPGITIVKQGDGTDGEFKINTWSANNTCGHDVLVQGIRFQGVWPGNTEDHNQNAGTIALDGEDLPLCLHHVVLHRVTVIDAQDSGGDIWGSAQDITFSYSAFLRSLHPNTYSHSTGDADQRRERISNHHNLYALIHERGPQVRGEVRDLNIEQSIFHQWAGFGFPGGYATRIRCLNAFCPQRVNLIGNHWTSGGDNLDSALVMGNVAGPGDDDSIPSQVFMSGNRLPAQNVDSGTASMEFPRPVEAVVTLYPASELVSQVLPNIGVPYRTPEEMALFDDVAVQLQSEL